MVYSNKFVMCVLVNGRPQKELANGVVTLPFGTEYVLRFRNKNNRRAVVQIYIDGENVSGAGYIVNANDYTDIKRHHDVDRAFKFVSLDSEDAIEHGKNGPNPDKVKGTIEARFYLEKEQPQVIYRDVHHHHDHYYPRPVPMPKPQPYPWYNGPTWTCDAGEASKGGGGVSYGMSSGGGDLYASNSIQCSTGGGTSMSSGPLRSAKSRTVKTQNLSFNEEPVTQDGCTVEGNLTGQNFRTVFCDTESTFTSLKIFLQGVEEEVEEVAVVKATKKRKTNKDQIIDNLEDENDQLRQEIDRLKSEKRRKKQREDKEKLLQETNEKLKKELEELQQE